MSYLELEDTDLTKPLHQLMQTRLRKRIDWPPLPWSVSANVSSPSCVSPTHPGIGNIAVIPYYLILFYFT